MIETRWMHSIRKGREVCIGWYEGNFKNTAELEKELSEQVGQLETGVFLAFNPKTLNALLICINKDFRVAEKAYKNGLEQILSHGRLKEEMKFKKTGHGVIGIAAINTDLAKGMTDRKKAIPLIEESFKDIENEIEKWLEKKGYGKGKLT